MSLINDALKRANQTMKSNPNSVGGIRLEPAQSGNQNFFKMLVVPLILVVLAGAGGWFLWKAKNQQRQGNAAVQNTNAATKTNVIASLPKTNTVKPSTTTTVTSTQPSTSTVNKSATPNKSTTPQTATTQKSTPKTNKQATVTPPAETNGVELPKEVVVVKPTNFPPLKLQSIFPLRSRPSAMINNRTLTVGDFIDGVKIVEINKTHVSVEFQGYTEKLHAPR